MHVYAYAAVTSLVLTPQKLIVMTAHAPEQTAMSTDGKHIGECCVDLGVQLKVTVYIVNM